MSEIPEDIREKAKRFAQIAHTFTHRADFEAIIAEVCAKVLAAERKDATERAAKIAESNDHFPEEGEFIASAIRGEGREG